MNKVLMLLICLLFITQVSFGEDLLIRKPYELILAVDEETYFRATVEESPYVLEDNTVQIYPGEVLFIEVELQENKIIKLVAVKENKDPEKTIEINFSQESEGNIHQMMLLNIKNPFKKDLNYNAFIYPMEYKKWVPTSVLPIESEKSSYEVWPDIIISIALKNWSLEDNTK